MVSHSSSGRLEYTMQTRSTATNAKSAPDAVAKAKTANSSSQAAASQDAQTQKSASEQEQTTATSSRESVTQQVFLQTDTNEDVKMVQASQASNSLIMSSSQNCLRQMHRNDEARGRLFSVGISTQTKSSKNLDYVRLSSADGITLYCKADTAVPFTFRFSTECHANMKLRIRAEYTEDRYASKPVERCPNHLVKDSKIPDVEARDHFIRCEHPEAKYLGVEDAFAVQIPICESTGFIFTCFSSCSGGINRRPLQIAFILEESNGRIIDTCYVALKVCANPLRDASKENGRFDSSRVLEYGGPGLQRKRPQRFTGEIVKRPPFRGFMEETCTPCEIHLADPVKLRKVLWVLMNEEKFDRIMEMAKEGNFFRDHRTLSADTAIKDWLNRSEIGLGILASDFERKSIFTLGDLSKVYRSDTFARLGFTTEQCILLNRVFQEWNQMNRAIATGQVSVANGMGQYPPI